MAEIDYEEVLNRINSIYYSCNEVEQHQLRQIVEETAVHGYSETLEKLWLVDFKEVPISIDRFLSDPQYMGNVTRNGDAIYPYWRSMMNTVFSAGNKYNEIILTGATRLGKSSTAVAIGCYMLYRLMLYRNPHEYFQKKEISKFTLAFANLTKDLAYGVAYREYQDTLRDCPWFLDHGTFSKSDRNFYYVPEGNKIEIIAGSSSSMFLGKQVFFAMIDETNFAKTGVKDIEIAKAHMKNLYDTLMARISGSFRIGGQVYGKMISCSSKNTDSDFLSTHIEKQTQANNEHLYIVDEPQWNVLPPSMFSNKKFHFTIGDRYKRGFVIPEENDDLEHIQEYQNQGYTIMEAPAELRTNFVADYDIALRDIAGVSVSGTMGFITQAAITPCVVQDRVNPFFEDILVIGTHDDLAIEHFFHEEKVPESLKRSKINIHLDLGETENRTGIAGCCVYGNKIITDETGKRIALPYIREVFSVAIEAPRGDRQSFQKIVNFMVYLRRKHFNIGTISTDQFQSDYLRETLEQQGFDVCKVSVQMDPYIGLRSLINEQRIDLIKNELQETELINTQRMNNRIIHPIDKGGGHGDVADALCGSSWTLVTTKATSGTSTKSAVSIAANVNSNKVTTSNKSYANPLIAGASINKRR